MTQLCEDLPGSIARRICSQDVLPVLGERFLSRGLPMHIRSNHDSKFIVRPLRRWLETLQVKPLYIALGSPWDNGHLKSFSGNMHDQFLASDYVYTFNEIPIMTEHWRRRYNTVQPCRSLVRQPPTPETLGLAR